MASYYNYLYKGRGKVLIFGAGLRQGLTQNGLTVKCWAVPQN